MVESVSNLSRSGLRDWLLQRITAVILAAYVIFLAFYFMCHPHVEYNMWQDLFMSNSVRIFSLLALMSLMVHAWIGVWTIATDYINCTILRGLFEIIVALALIVCFIWGITILWSV